MSAYMGDAVLLYLRALRIFREWQWERLRPDLRLLWCQEA